MVTVTGENPQWSNHELTLGTYGAGTLNVLDGGVVSNTRGYIGRYSGPTGVATVTGVGSRWDNLFNLHVGRSGTGTLDIADDGLVTVGGLTSIGTAGTVHLTGGRFEFSQTMLATPTFPR